MIDFDRLYESLPTHGWLKKDEARLLLDSAKDTEGTILEVGTYYGKSACLLASLGRPVICVDPFKNFNTDDPSGNVIEAGLWENLRYRGIENVTVVRQPIEDWEKEPVGFVYLDGDHTYKGTRSQIEVAITCGVSTFCIHDYGHTTGGLLVKRAVQDLGVTLLELVGEMAYCQV